MRYLQAIFATQIYNAGKSLQGLQLIFLWLFMLAPIMGIYSQVPTNVPSPEAEPVGFFDSWQSVVLYFVVPAIIIVLYFVWRRRNNKQGGDR